MKQIALLIALCFGAWYYFVGGRTLDEGMVRVYYDRSAQAIHARDDQALCKLLSSKATANDETVMLGQTQRVSLNRDQQCEATKATFQALEQLGSLVAIEHQFQIDKITIAADRKSAMVEGTSVLKMGETTMQYHSTFSQKIVRELGQVKLMHSDQRTVVRMAGGRAMSQSDFFSK